MWKNIVNRSTEKMSNQEMQRKNTFEMLNKEMKENAKNYTIKSTVRSHTQPPFFQTMMIIIPYIRKTGSDISTSLIQGFNFTNSQFQLHEFTISTSRIHDFNFTNLISRIQLLEFNFTNSTSRIQELNS